MFLFFYILFYVSSLTLFHTLMLWCSPSWELKDAYINNKLLAPYGIHGAYHVQKNSQLIPIVSQINTVHTLKVICYVTLFYSESRVSILNIWYLKLFFLSNLWLNKSDICKYEWEISYIVTKYIFCNSAHLFVTHHNAGSQAISMWHRNILWLRPRIWLIMSLSSYQKLH
jgi:hypothetical protein